MKRFLEIVPPDETNTIELTLATESQVDRGAFIEVLSCQPEDVDISRLDCLPFLYNHNPDILLGKFKSVKVADNKVKATVLLDPTSPHFAAIKSGILCSVSVGYEIEAKPLRTEKTPDGKNVLTFKWKIYEGSAVTIPADQFAGIYRGLETPSVSAPVTAPATFKDTNSNMNTAEITECLDLASKHNKIELARKHIAANSTLDAFRAELLSTVSAAPVSTFDKKEMQTIGKRYSILRAIRSMVPGYKEDAGFEQEISQEIARRSGKNPNGLYIPVQLLGKRDLSVAGTSGNTVATEIADYVAPLYANTVATKLGAQVLGGLSGDIQVPVVTSGSVYWVSSEGGSPTESAPAIAQIKSAPHTLGGYTDITRKFMNQSSVAADMLVANDLTSKIEQEIDNAFFNATGLSGSPDGLAQMFTDNSISAMAIATNGTPTYAEVLAFEAAIRGDDVNADLKWAISPATWATLSATARATGSGFVLDNGKLAGRDYMVSSHVAGAVLGDFTTALICAYGAGVDITVDTATLSSSGGIRLVALQDVDFLFRQPKAFRFTTDTEMNG